MSQTLKKMRKLHGLSLPYSRPAQLMTIQIDEDPQIFLQNIIEFLGKMYANKDKECNDDQQIEPKIDA